MILFLRRLFRWYYVNALGIFLAVMLTTAMVSFAILLLAACGLGAPWWGWALISAGLAIRLTRALTAPVRL